jgi:hypothetical protein
VYRDTGKLRFSKRIEGKVGSGRACGLLVVSCLLCAFVLSGKHLRAQSNGALPAAQVVLDRHVEATGGKDALLRHKSMTMHGRYQEPNRKLDVETTFYTKGGNKMLLRATLPGNKEYASGYDSETAWALHPDGTAEVHDDADYLKTTARDADMYYHLHVLQYFRSMEVVDVQQFNGRPCYHLRGINNWGKVNEQFYDKENGLLLGYKFNTAWRGGKGDASVTFEDYRDFDGVKMAAKTTSRDGDDLSISLITSVTYDDVDDQVFALPAAIKAKLAEKKNSGKSGAPRAP